MNDLQIFTNDSFGQIRMLEIDDEPWFVGKEVAEILGYVNASKALADHVDEEDKLLIDTKTQSHFGLELGQKLNNDLLSSLGQRGGWLINEPGFYDLVNHSKLETAKPFKKWVTHEVLPSIRKTGEYSIQPIQQPVIDPYKITVVQQIELQKEQNRSKELDIELFKLQFEKENRECELQSSQNEISESDIFDAQTNIHSTGNYGKYGNITSVAEILSKRLNVNITAQDLNNFLQSEDLLQKDKHLIIENKPYYFAYFYDLFFKQNSILCYEIDNYAPKDNHYSVKASWHKNNAADYFEASQYELFNFLRTYKKSFNK